MLCSKPSVKRSSLLTTVFLSYKEFSRNIAKLCDHKEMFSPVP